MRQNKPLKSSRWFVLLLKLQFWHFFPFGLKPPCLSFQRVFQAKRYLRPTWMIFEKTWFCKNDISSREIWLSRFMLTCHYPLHNKAWDPNKIVQMPKMARKTSTSSSACSFITSRQILQFCFALGKLRLRIENVNKIE